MLRGTTQHQYLFYPIPARLRCYLLVIEKTVKLDCHHLQCPTKSLLFYRPHRTSGLVVKARTTSGSSLKYDVIVIGAGLAGLSAASHIIKAGHSCIVLEARDRVGGRTWSQKLSSRNTVYEIGAAWINDVNQTEMTELARQLGLEFIEQNTEGGIVLEDVDNKLQHFPYGELPGYSQDIRKNLEHIRDTAEAMCQTLTVSDADDQESARLDPITFLAYHEELGADDKAIHTAAVWTRAMLGQDPSDISTLFFLHYCKSGGGLIQMRSDKKGGGQHLRIRQGTQAFSIGLADTLPQGTIHFNLPVTRIEQKGSQTLLVSAGSEGMQFQARKVLSAVPQPVLKEIEFQPRLPPAKEQLVNSYKYGYCQKVLVIFQTPFWIKKGSCELVQSFIGPACVVRDTSVPAEDKHVSICFVGGSVGATWSKLPAKERQEAILKQLADVFEDESTIRTQYIEMIGHQWNDERWNGYGCPSPSPLPGALSTVGDALNASVGDIHFAGTETSDVWRGYMEGAVRSGHKEAQLILKDLKKAAA